MALTLLIIAQLIGLIIIPLGLPGIWLQVGALVVFGYATGFATVGVYTIVIVLSLALLAELAEFLMAGGFARRYGGGRRAAVGAMVGAVTGAIVGVPLPIIGSVIGAMIGSFAGAILLELTRRDGAAPAIRAGWGALLGWLVSVAVKSGVGVTIAVFTLFVAAR